MGAVSATFRGYRIYIFWPIYLEIGDNVANILLIKCVNSGENRWDSFWMPVNFPRGTGNKNRKIANSNTIWYMRFSVETTFLNLLTWKYMSMLPKGCTLCLQILVKIASLVFDSWSIYRVTWKIGKKIIDFWLGVLGWS